MIYQKNRRILLREPGGDEGSGGAIKLAVVNVEILLYSD